MHIAKPFFFECDDTDVKARVRVGNTRWAVVKEVIENVNDAFRCRAVIHRCYRRSASISWDRSQAGKRKYYAIHDVTMSYTSSMILPPY
jgi:hypothetical protein